MDIEYDPTKNEKNISERQLSFERAREFQFESALIAIDDRRDYGETRYVAIGYVDDRLHVLCFKETEAGIRVISFRKANDREVKHYGRTQTTD